VQSVTKQAIGQLACGLPECGVYVMEMETIVRPKNFPLWFAERGFECLAAAKSFAEFAGEARSNVGQLQAHALCLPGIVESQKREAGEQKRLPRTQCQWLRFIMRATKAIKAAIGQSPIEDWPAPHLVTLQDSLRPFVELHRKLEELCES
jgi:hypothetical protein